MRAPEHNKTEISFWWWLSAKSRISTLLIHNVSFTYYRENRLVTGFIHTFLYYYYIFYALLLERVQPKTYDIVQPPPLKRCVDVCRAQHKIERVRTAFWSCRLGPRKAAKPVGARPFQSITVGLPLDWNWWSIFERCYQHVLCSVCVSPLAIADSERF